MLAGAVAVSLIAAPSDQINWLRLFSGVAAAAKLRARGFSSAGAFVSVVVEEESAASSFNATLRASSSLWICLICASRREIRASISFIRVLLQCDEIASTNNVQIRCQSIRGGTLPTRIRAQFLAQKQNSLARRRRNPDYSERVGKRDKSEEH